MLVAFAAALKHQLRFEPFTCYGDVGPLGNVPLALLAHGAAYVKRVMDDGTLARVPCQTAALHTLARLHDVQAGTNRIVP